MSSTYPLHELRALLRQDTPTVGVVVAVDGARLQIATTEGLRPALASGRIPAVGDAVSLRDGVAYPRAVASRRYVV
jgi:hypothetical protein